MTEKGKERQQNLKKEEKRDKPAEEWFICYALPY